MNKSEFVYPIVIVSSPARIWEALTTPEATEKYFYGRRIELGQEVGAPFRLWMQDGTLDTQGEVRRFEPPHVLEVTWHVEWVEEMRSLPPTLVSFRIDDLGTVSRLTVTNSWTEGEVPEEFLERGREGWTVILSGLKTLLETGQPMPELDSMKA